MVEGFDSGTARRRWLVPMVTLAALLMARVLDPQVLQDMRFTGFDLQQHLFPRAANERPVLIVDIDEASLAEYGQWPWPRSLVAELVDSSAAHGAAVIGIDIIFPEPDRFAPQRTGYVSNDEILAESLRRHQAVIGFALVPRTGSRGGDKARRTPFLERGGDPRAFLEPHSGLLQNVAPLQAASAGQGLLSLELERDGVIRRLPAVASIDDDLIPSLGIEMLRVMEQAAGITVTTNRAGVAELQVGDRTVRTSTRGGVWVHFSQHDPGRFVSAVDVLAGTIADDAFNGEAILIGSTAAGLGDIIATPLGSMSGVEVHAQLLENVLTGTLLSRGGALPVLELLITLGLGLGLVLGSRRAGPGAMVLGGLVAALLIAAWLSFTRFGVLMDVSFTILALVLMHLTGIIDRSFATERARRELAEHAAAALRDRDARLSALRGQLIDTSRTTALQQYAASLGHEINQPLTAIANYVQACRRLINANRADPAQTLIIMDKAAGQIDRATTIIRGLRDDVEGGVVETTLESINDLTSEAADMALDLDSRDGAQVGVTWDLGDDLPPIPVNKVQVQQVIFNLIRNAMEAMAGAADRRLTVRTLRAAGGTGVEITIADNGPGLATDLIDEVFQPFASTKTSGMGMGLAICRNIVERHGGEIWAEKDAATGAAFHIVLPSAPATDRPTT